MASLFIRKDWYYLAFYSIHQHPRLIQINLRTKTKRVAERLKVSLEDRWALGEFDPWINKDWQLRAVENQTVAKGIALFIQVQDHVQPQTIQKYKSVLGQLSLFVGSGFLLSNISPETVHRFLYARKRASVTRKTYSTTLSPFFEWSCKLGYMSLNPVHGLKLEKVPYKFPRYLTVQEVDLLCDTIEEVQLASESQGLNPSWLAPVVRAAVLTGMRIGELVNLQWSHVDTLKNTISVKQEGTFETKSKRDRIIPLTDELARLLNSLPQTSKWVLTSFSGEKLFPQYVSRRFKHFCNLLELDAKFHTLRHSAASWLVEAGCSLESIRQLLGHSSIRVTERYIHTKDSLYLNEIRSLQSSYVESKRQKS